MGAYGNYGYSDYSYGGYPNYNRQSGSMLGNTSMSQAFSQMAVSPNLEASNVDNITRGLSDTYNRALEPPKKKGLFGKIGDFFKGIVKGFTNLVKSLADPKTWLMIAAMVALCMLVPGAGTALMMLGIGLAGLQIFKGVSSGNAEQVGEGTFNLGLAFVGGKSAGTGVKAGKGAEKATFTRAGTRVAEAEKNLAKVKANKGNKTAEAHKAEVDKAEATLASAQKAQARAELHGMNKTQRNDLLEKKKISKLDSVKAFDESITTTSERLMASRKAAAEAKDSLQKVKNAENQADIKAAETALAKIETDITAARKDLNDLYMARHLKFQEAEKLTLWQKTQHYLRSAKTSAGEHVMSFSGRPLTSVDGRTITYWSRTPKKNPVAAESEVAAVNATKSVKPWYKPWTWFRSGKTDKTAAGQPKAQDAKQPGNATANAEATPSKDAAGQTVSDMKEWAIVPYAPYKPPTVVPVQPVGFWGKTKAGVREHGFSSFIHANMTDDLFHPLLIQMGLPEQGLLG